MNTRLFSVRRCQRLLATIAAVATLLPVAWAAPQTEEIPFDPEVIRGTLGNGLTYYVKGNREPRDRMQLSLAVRAGSVLEQEHERGLAHFIEHMAFNGTASFPGNEIISYLESIGSAFGPDVNAYTGFDETVYTLDLPAGDPAVLATGFDILSEWAYAISFDPEELGTGAWRGAGGTTTGAWCKTAYLGSATAGALRRLPVLEAVADRPAGDHRDCVGR